MVHTKFRCCKKDGNNSVLPPYFFMGKWGEMKENEGKTQDDSDENYFGTIPL